MEISRFKDLLEKQRQSERRFFRKSSKILQSDEDQNKAKVRFCYV